MIQGHPEFIDEVTSWVDSENKWLRRASIVPFAKLARNGQHIDVVHKTAAKLFNDGEDLIQKAAGWILRESGKTDMNRLEQFLREHGKRIPRTTLRYAIERFPETKRKDLLNQTK
jgi:3-methyladenine DNA glycosylase AlkD